MKNLKLFGILVAMSALVYSCINVDDDGNYIDSENSTWLAFINASPGSESLKFYNNGSSLNVPSLTYGNFYGYLQQEKGAASLTVRTSTSNDLDTLNINLSSNTLYSIYAVNTPDHLELISLIDNHEDTPPGKSSIRFIQLSPDSPALKLEIEGEEGSLGTYDFKDSSAFINVNFGIDRNFILRDAETNEILFSKEISLGGGKAYSIFSKGLLSSTLDDEKLDLQVITFQ